MFKGYSLQEKHDLKGYAFVLPFVIGFIMFYLYPFIQSIRFSFSELSITSGGYEMSFVGWGNYYKAIFVNADFIRVFTNTMVATIRNVPAVLIFSLFVAIILNQKFRGRLFARVVFFLPVILTAGVIKLLEQKDFLTQTMVGQQQAAAESGIGFMGAFMRDFLMTVKFPEEILIYVVTAVDIIPQIINASAIPILIFLAGLQSVPSSLYESAQIEGATKWEILWKITIPLVSPLILTNVVFIFIDSFTATDNPLLMLLQETAWGGMGYGVSIAMSWLYFLAIFLVLAGIIGTFSRTVFYQE